MSDNNKISLIIPVYNALNDFSHCIRSVLKNFDFSKGDVLIADDCSNFKTAKYIDKIIKQYPFIKMIRNEQNLGYLKTCNQAVKKVNGDIVVLLNSDTEIDKYFSEKVIACFDSDKKIVAASPISSNSSDYWIPCIFPYKFMGRILSENKPCYPDVLNSEGFAFCVRRDYLLENGLFDDIYKWGYCEEVDFCLKAKFLGYRTVLIDNLYVKHKQNRSFGKKKLELLAENNKVLYSRWGNFIDKSIYDSSKTVNNIISKCFGKFERFILFRYLRLYRFLNNSRLIKLINFININRNSKYKRIVYTCITGSVDKIPIIHSYIDKDSLYVCFTDSKPLLRIKKIGPWNIRKLEFSALDDVKNARWHKTHPHKLFPNYDEVIWIDGNIDILTDNLFKTIERKDSKLLVPIHYCRNDIYKEAEMVSELGKDKNDSIEKLINYLKIHNFPEKFGLNETNIIYSRPKEIVVSKIMEDWWYMIENFSKRDQLSFSYVLWKNGVKIPDICIPNARIDCLNYRIYTH